MQPLFTGSSRQLRNIDLSGSSHAKPKDVREARLARERERANSQAAVRIQRVFRSYRIRKHVKAQWASEADRSQWTGGNLIDNTALLLASFQGSRDELQRFGKFARYVIVEKMLFVPFEMPTTSARWASLTQRLALDLLQLACKYPEAPQVPLFFQLIKQLCDATKYPPAVRPFADFLIQFLVLRKSMYRLLRQHITGIPVQHNSAPSLPSAVSLAMLPLKSTRVSEYIPSFSQEILTIPLLLNRLPTSAVAQVASGLPCAALLEWFNENLTCLISSRFAAIALLANLLPLVQPRLSTLTKVEHFVGWLEFLTACLTALPLTLMSKIDKGKSKATDMDIDGDPPSTSAPSSLDFHPKQAAQLHKLASAAELEPLLVLSARFASSPLSRPALARFLSVLLSVLPTKSKEDVLTLVLYHRQGGGGLLREIWRGWLRSGQIWQTIVGERGKDGWGAVLPQLNSTVSPAAQAEWPLFVLFIQLYTRMLLSLGDDEFYAAPSTKTRNPILLDDIKSFSALLRNIGFALYWTETDIERLAVPGVPNLHGEELRTLVRTLLVAIHERDSRRSFLPSDHFIMTGAFDVQKFVDTALLEDQRLDEEAEGFAAADDPSDSSDNEEEEIARPKPTLSTRASLSRRKIAFLSPRLGLLNNIPFVVPFDTRVSVFRKLALNDKQRQYSRESFTERRTAAAIRRDHLSEDGFTHLHNLGPQGFKRRLQITFVDEFGIDESGIDGGGLFKEFLTALGKEAFDPNRGLWSTNSRHEVYPAAHEYAKSSHARDWFKFMGQIIGKALYEGILVPVPFAGFFLSKWLGKSSFIDDLESLDPALYQGFVQLKNETSDVSNMCITFSVDEEDMGVTRTVDLIPNGRDVLVTNENRYRYIALMSHYRLNTQIKEQSAAFVSGLQDLINPRWLRLFSQAELRLLVGGTEEPIDIDDLRRNTVYHSIEESCDTVRYFWDVLREFNAEQRRDFIKFVTAADKAPLLGFKELQPLFAVQGTSDTTRLPTSATCMNLLKLPRYTDRAQLKQKLLVSITSHSGFDLS